MRNLHDLRSFLKPGCAAVTVRSFRQEIGSTGHCCAMHCKAVNNTDALAVHVLTQIMLIAFTSLLLLLQVLDDKVLLSSSSAVALAAISAAGGQRP
jgi:hypothetical protein